MPTSLDSNQIVPVGVSWLQHTVDGGESAIHALFAELTALEHVLAPLLPRQDDMPVTGLMPDTIEPTPIESISLVERMAMTVQLITKASDRIAALNRQIRI